MDDTWLCEEPIPLKETKACWYWAIQIGIETVPEDKFEDTNTKIEALPDTLDCAKDIAMKSEFIKRIIEQ